MQPFRIVLASMLLWCAVVCRVQGGALVQPKILEPAEGVFAKGKRSQILVGANLQKTAPQVVSALKPLIAWLGGAKKATPPQSLPDTPYLLVGLTTDHTALQQLRDGWNTKLPMNGLGEEGYLLDITPQHIHLTAERPAGVLYGILYLLSQLESKAYEVGIPAVKLADWATLRWRGMHLLVNGRQDIPALEQLIKEYLPQLRFNQLILEINYNFEYKSHPEIAVQNALTLDDCRHLNAIAKQSFIRIIPMINCLGHQSWAETTYSLLTHHPEFDETPNYPKDNKGIYCRSWCPSHPDLNPILFALFDELIDAFHADAFHVGMDEVFILGKCSRCKGKHNADLFAKAVKEYHQHLVGKRKVEMYLWGDRLLDGIGMKLGEWEASTNDTAPAIDKIPKDIVLCDWHYETPDDFPSLAYLQSKGFRVIPSTWNQIENVKRFTSLALKHQGAKLPGYLATTWASVASVVSRLQGIPQPSIGSGERKKETDLGGAIRLGAKMAWEGR